MDEVGRETRRIFRLMGRGRDEAAPVYLYTTVFLTIALAVAAVTGIAFAVSTSASCGRFFPCGPGSPPEND